MKYRRRVLGVRRVEKRCYEDIRKELGVLSVKEYLEDKKFSWLGY